MQYSKTLNQYMVAALRNDPAADYLALQFSDLLPRVGTGILYPVHRSNKEYFIERAQTFRGRNLQRKGLFLVRIFFRTLWRY